MIDILELKNYCDNLLEIEKFKDYCPNGLQISGKNKIKKIVCGVSANLEFIKKSISKKTDAIFVHHGFFWKNENPCLVGIKKDRIAQILAKNISLFAYHIPLDAHNNLGNNYQIGKLLGITNTINVENSLLWCGNLEKKISQKEFISLVEKKISYKPTLFTKSNKKIKKIAWCTGAGQDFIEKAIDLGADIYLSGEVSERIPHIAYESNIIYCQAGHHATERYGIQALGKHISNKFSLDYEYIEIKNKV